jgi:ABC-2 type transport system permease protein
MKSVYLLELRSIFTSVRGYLFLGLTLFLDGLFISFLNLYTGYINLEYSLEYCSAVFMLCLPLLTVCAFAPDAKSGFDKMLGCIVGSKTSLLFGKTLAILTVSAVPAVFLALLPPVFAMFGKPNILAAYAGIFGYLLVSVAFAALGIFISSVTKGKLVCSVITYAVFGCMYLMRTLAPMIPSDAFAAFAVLSVIVLLLAIAVYFVSGSEFFTVGFVAVCELLLLVLRFALPNAFITLPETVLSALSLLGAYDGFVMGLYKLSSVFTLLTFIAAMLVFTRVSLERKRYD